MVRDHLGRSSLSVGISAGGHCTRLNGPRRLRFHVSVGGDSWRLSSARRMDSSGVQSDPLLLGSSGFQSEGYSEQELPVLRHLALEVTQRRLSHSACQGSCEFLQIQRKRAGPHLSMNLQPCFNTATVLPVATNANLPLTGQRHSLPPQTLLYGIELQLRLRLEVRISSSSTPVLTRSSREATH